LSNAIYDLLDLSFLVIAIGALYFYQKKEIFVSLRLPFNIIYIVLIIDIVFRYFSFFPDSNVGGIITELSKNNPGFYPEIPSELSAISNYNRNWFSLPYINRANNSDFSFLLLLNNIAGFGLKIIIILLNLIAFKVLLNSIAITFELEGFKTKLNNLKNSIHQKVGDKLLLNGSFSNKLIRLTSLFILVFVGLKLATTFFINSSINTKVKEQTRIVYDSAFAKQAIITDSLAKIDSINKQIDQQFQNLSSALSELPITESAYEDSTFIVIVAMPNSYNEASEISDKLSQVGINAGNFEVPVEQSNGTTKYAAFIGSFNNRQTCFQALFSIRQIYPDAKAYYRSNETNQISLIE